MMPTRQRKAERAGEQSGDAVTWAHPTSYAEPGRDAAANRMLRPTQFPCALCGDARCEDVGHLLPRCTHERLVALRAAMIPPPPRQGVVVVAAVTTVG